MVPTIPPGAVVSGVFEKRQHSRIGTSKISATSAARLSVKYGAVAPKYEKNWVCLFDSGELQWNAIDDAEVVHSVGESCLVVNAFPTCEKKFLVEEVGEYDEDTAPYFYLLIATATRRLTLRTVSRTERDHWMGCLCKVVRDVAGLPLPSPDVSLVASAEMIFALAPMRWSISLRGRGQMTISRASFQVICERYDILAHSLTVDRVYDGLVTDHGHADEGLSFDRFLRYTRGLSKCSSSDGFDAIKNIFGGALSDALLVRTEELVQCKTANFSIANGTLYLTENFLLHQAWNLEKINVVPIASVKGVVEACGEGLLLQLSDSLVLMGADVYEIDTASFGAGLNNPLESSSLHKNIAYKIQFSVLKDMLVSSSKESEQGGRRGLWLDLLTEMVGAHHMSKQIGSRESRPGTSKLPTFAALNLVRSRAIFRASGCFSKDLFLCSSESPAALNIVELFSKSNPEDIQALANSVSLEARSSSFSQGGCQTVLQDAQQNVVVNEKAATEPSKELATEFSGNKAIDQLMPDNPPKKKILKMPAPVHAVHSRSGFTQWRRTALSLLGFSATLLLTAPRAGHGEQAAAGTGVVLQLSPVAAFFSIAAMYYTLYFI